MSKSTDALPLLLALLSREARRRGLTDTEWSARAGLRKETLSRLRRRRTCDLATLRSLAHATGYRLALQPDGDGEAAHLMPDGLIPAALDRDLEERLVELCRSGDTSFARWVALGPRFFMAGLAVMLAGSRGHDRRALLELAEQLHPGITEPVVFSTWLERSPVRPARFLPLVEVSDAA